MSLYFDVKRVFEAMFKEKGVTDEDTINFLLACPVGVEFGVILCAQYLSLRDTLSVAPIECLSLVFENLIITIREAQGIKNAKNN